VFFDLFKDKLLKLNAEVSY